MEQGRCFLLIYFISILTSFSSLAQPQFFIKELKTIPALDNGIIPKLCGNEGNWDCYFDTFYELWGSINEQKIIILNAKMMYQMEMYPYGVNKNEFYLLNDQKTLLIKTTCGS